MKAFLLGLALASVSVTAANAQSFDASRQMESFTKGALKATLAELGAQVEEKADMPNMTVVFSNGLKGDALLMACSDAETLTRCLGTSILVTYETPDDATPAQVRDGINEYNYRQNFGRAYLDPEGKISIRLYLIADGGMTMENYRQNIGLFALAVAKLPDYVYD